MKVINQSWEWIQRPRLPLELIELAGRTCYKSEDKITPESSRGFVKRLLESGHHSVIEHASASIKFITDRGVTHELVRHRLASYSQESTRYCNYGGDDIQFIKPVWLSKTLSHDNEDAMHTWLCIMQETETAYKVLIKKGWRPEQARSVLPNSLKTEIIMTANLREWMHVFKLRCSKAAHPQIRELMLSCLAGFQAEIPILFDNLP
jgi:thymidylate synthase (FAD)